MIKVFIPVAYSYFNRNEDCHHLDQSVIDWLIENSNLSLRDLDNPELITWFLVGETPDRIRFKFDESLADLAMRFKLTFSGY
jgi:hypothetical protein